MEQPPPYAFKPRINTNDLLPHIIRVRLVETVHIPNTRIQ